MLRVLIRSASARRFLWVPTTGFYGKIRKILVLFGWKKKKKTPYLELEMYHWYSLIQKWCHTYICFIHKCQRIWTFYQRTCSEIWVLVLQPVNTIKVILSQLAIRPRGYKTFFMLNSAEHEIFPVNKSQVTNNCKFFLAKHSWEWKIFCYKYENANYCAFSYL